MVNLFFDTDGFYSAENATDEELMRRRVHAANSYLNTAAIATIEGDRSTTGGVPVSNGAFVARLVVRRPYGGAPIETIPYRHHGEEDAFLIRGRNSDQKIVDVVDAEELSNEAGLVSKEYLRSLNQLSVPTIIANQFGIPPQEAGYQMSAWETMSSLSRFAARTLHARRRLLHPALLRPMALLPGLMRFATQDNKREGVVKGQAITVARRQALIRMGLQDWKGGEGGGGGGQGSVMARDGRTGGDEGTGTLLPALGVRGPIRARVEVVAAGSQGRDSLRSNPKHTHM